MKANTNDNVICEICGKEMNLYYHSGYQLIYKCRKCKMMHAQLEENIDVSQFKQRNIENMKLNRICRLAKDKDRLISIRKYFKRDISMCKVLDIGCGIGTFLELCHDLDVDYYGIEPNRILYNYCLEHFPRYKNKIFNNTLKEVNFMLNNFDLIVMNHVLEHVDAPLEFLIDCRKRLKRGGAIYIEVPNESFVLIKSKIKKMLKVYSGVPTNIEHRSLFTAVTLKKIIKEAGFKNYIGLQKSLWGNMNGIKIGMGNKPIPIILRIATIFFKLTKLDVLLKQGLLAGVAFK